MHPILAAIENQFIPPLGFCQCGCGAPTTLADRRDFLRMGYSVGTPLPYVKGHARAYTDLETELRFWTKTRLAPSGCLEWTGEIMWKGYGIVKIRGRRVRAHRYAYELCKGPIPEGLEPDHLCRNTRCVLPDHLEAVTRRTNLIRATSPVALNVRKTHCPRGHELPPVQEGKRRACRICKTDMQRERRHYGR